MVDNLLVIHGISKFCKALDSPHCPISRVWCDSGRRIGRRVMAMGCAGTSDRILFLTLYGRSYRRRRIGENNRGNTKAESSLS